MATTSTSSSAEILEIYVEEQNGSDEIGDGSIQKPYQSAAQAVFNHNSSPHLKILVRKAEADEWQEITATALKKARKGAEGIEKKRKKALEAEAKAAEKAIQQEKTNVIVLEEDTSLPQAIKVIFSFLTRSNAVALTFFCRARSSILRNTEDRESRSQDGFIDCVHRGK
ncbi:hypothetical protein FRB91_008002 [Serendipita sp. 411]|nr:hypothetical protein FRB91_008002 [Serendipita sp. 411]